MLPVATVLPVANIAMVEQKHVLANLLQYYLYDFSEFSDDQISRDGSFDYPYLDYYWQDPERTPYLFYLDGKPVGFALVRVETDPANGNKCTDLAEFFILRPYRRRGYGSTLALSVWRCHPGTWKVRVLQTNKAAYLFWKQVIGKFTAGDFLETTLSVQPFIEFEFESG